MSRAHWMTSRYRFRFVIDVMPHYDQGETIEYPPDVTDWIHADTLAEIRSDADSTGYDRVEIERALPARRRKSSGIDYEPYGVLRNGRITTDVRHLSADRDRMEAPRDPQPSLG
jgi:hypothetical protein